MVNADSKKRLAREKFGKAFKRLKREKNVAHVKIHKALGVPYATLWQWDKGNCLPRHDDLITLANFFGVSLEEMLGI